MESLLLFLGAFALTLLPLLAASELGLKLGQRHRTGVDADGKTQISMVEGALLGLLALLVGFTFSMAVGRYDARQDQLVREANAVGTLGLRLDFLPEEIRPAVRAKLRDYTQARVDFFNAGPDRAKVREAEDRADRLQVELWKPIRDEARLRPTPISLGLVMATNELFDVREIRLVAIDNTVPMGVWIVLYSVAVLTAGSLGFGSGLTGRRLTLPIHMVPVMLAVILSLLIDLDHPRRGLIKISQDCMLRARDGLK